MLGKLIKYEFKATGRILVPLYIAILILSLFNNVVFTMGDDFKISFSTAYVILIIAYAVVMAAIFIMTFVIIIQRFYKNLFGDEGYLMNTLPVTSGQNIWAKVIVSTIWTIASGVVATLSVILLLIKKGIILEVFNNFNIVIDMFEKVNTEIGMYFYIIFLEVVLLMIISIAIGIITVYASMAIGHLVPRHKVLGSFGGFILIDIVIEKISSIFIGTGVLKFFDASRPEAIVEFLLIILVEILIFTGLFMFCKFIIDRKLNLE